MALTLSIEGKGVIANCDALTNDTGGTGTGDWSEQGGGTMSLTTDVYLYGSSSIAGKYASKSGFQQFDLGAGNELDFDVAGTEEGQFIFMWVNLSTFGVLQTLANKGLAIRISSSSPGTSNYKDYIIAGSDGANGWTGGWKLFVIDPTKTASASSGTCDIGAIRTIGVWIDTAASVRAESLFIDQIAVGKGLRVTGSSTQGWKDVVDYCTDYSNRAWGMFQEVDGIYYSFGKTFIGDSTQTAITDFKDAGRIIKYGTSQYYESSAWKTSYDIDGAGIVFDDAASYETKYEDGIIVGTDNGRSGTTVIGNADQDVAIDFSGMSNASSYAKCYASQFIDCGGITYHNDTASLFYGGNVASCDQFDAVGAAVIRNCTFAETVNTDAALLWNESIDVQKCKFIANTLGAAIEHPSGAGTPYDYYDLTFSGNTFDGLNTAGSNITVNNNGTSDAANDEGANTITYLSSATLSMTVKDESGAVVVGANAYIDDNNITPFIMNTTTNASGVASVGHTAGAVTGATWRVRKYGYKAYKAIADIPASGTKDIPVTLIADPQQN